MISAILSTSSRSHTRLVASVGRNGPRLSADVISFKRSFSTNSALDTKVRRAVDDYMKLRKSEAREFNSSIPIKPEPGVIDGPSLNLSSDPSESFASMGLDGLDEVELVLTIESKFGITLSDEDFHAIHSVADAVRIIDKITNNDAR
jgi:acyl carrier protein